MGGPRSRPAWAGGLRMLATCLLMLLGLSPAAASGAAELVMFDEPGCPWCRKWDREVGPGYVLSEEGRRAPLRRIDIRRAREAGLKLAAPVTVTPTFVLVERGAEIGRITGYPGADFFWGLLGELMARLTPRAPAAQPVLREAGMSSQSLTGEVSRGHPAEEPIRSGHRGLQTIGLIRGVFSKLGD